MVANVRPVAWVNVVGLVCDIGGTMWLALGLFIDEDDAIKLRLPHRAALIPE